VDLGNSHDVLRLRKGVKSVDRSIAGWDKDEKGGEERQVYIGVGQPYVQMLCQWVRAAKE
jgi:hypothetical protein